MTLYSLSLYLNSVCVIEGCEVCAYWSFRHRLLHQTNNSYHNDIIQSCYRVTAYYKRVHCMYIVDGYCISALRLKTKCVKTREGEVRGGSPEVVGEGGGGGGS